jgi:hypothetical protein
MQATTARPLKVGTNRDPGSQSTRIGAAGWWDDDRSATGLQVSRIDSLNVLRGDVDGT